MRGITLTELLVSIIVSSIIMTAIVALLFTSERSFKKTKNVMDAKEAAVAGMAQLEWLFQRWGTSTPCSSSGATCLSNVDCRVGGSFVYPPPSSMCITIDEGNPCDRIAFYANLYGNGFVALVRGENSVDVVSCRLNSSSSQNCYHLIRSVNPVLTDTGEVARFSVSGLSPNNVGCYDPDMSPNASMDRRLSVLNGTIDGSSVFVLEGGDMLLRVPHRVELFCQQNPSDNNRLWLYMRLTDMAPECNANEPPQPIAPVESFQAERLTTGVGVYLRIVFKNSKEPSDPEYQTFPVERYFGR